jgi:hypothetical protein
MIESWRFERMQDEIDRAHEADGQYFNAGKLPFDVEDVEALLEIRRRAEGLLFADPDELRETIATALHRSYVNGVEACRNCAEGLRHPLYDRTDLRHADAVLAAISGPPSSRGRQCARLVVPGEGAMETLVDCDRHGLIGRVAPGDDSVNELWARHMAEQTERS